MTKVKGKKSSTKAANKSSGVNSALAAGVANLSLESPLKNDVSPLILSNAATHGKLPYIGPISLVQQSQSVVHGRGLITTRDVSAGDCLFVIPAVAAAPIDEVYDRFRGDEEGDEDYDDIDDNVEASKSSNNFIKNGAYLESISEDMLIEQIQQLMDVIDDEESHPKKHVDCARSLLHAFVSQMSFDEVPSTATNEDELMSILLLSNRNSNTNNETLNRDAILNIIRRNAFGPDFHNYDVVAECWNNNPDGKRFYNRLLASYPLSAMINHSCSPNAVRIFGRIRSEIGNDFSDKIQGKEVMIVHANKSIPKGTEITWSYIPPSIPLDERREALLSKYGITCNCLRCVHEEVALKHNPLARLGSRLPENEASMRDMIETIEQTSSFNEIRVSYAPLYLEYFNTALPSSLHNNDKIIDILKLATGLHFSFLSCNNACTEHLSILHMCYELAGLLHTHAMRHDHEGANKTLSQVRFWTEQLKKTVMTRYGRLGENLENVRYIMKHSRTVLRTRDGWYVVKDKFI